MALLVVVRPASGTLTSGSNKRLAGSQPAEPPPFWFQLDVTGDGLPEVFVRSPEPGDETYEVLTVDADRRLERIGDVTVRTALTYAQGGVMVTYMKDAVGAGTFVCYGFDGHGPFTVGSFFARQGEDAYDREMRRLESKPAAARLNPPDLPLPFERAPLRESTLFAVESRYRVEAGSLVSESVETYRLFAKSDQVEWSQRLPQLRRKDSLAPQFTPGSRHVGYEIQVWNPGTLGSLWSVAFGLVTSVTDHPGVAFEDDGGLHSWLTSRVASVTLARRARGLQCPPG